MSSKNIKYLLLILIINFSCSKNNENDIILQIGEYKLNVYDYEKLKVLYQDKFSNEQIEKKVIEDGYIIAHSMNNRLDTISTLSKKLEYALYLYTSDVDGYMWNKNVAPLLKISNKDIKDAYEKRKREYIIYVIYFPDNSLVNKYITDESMIQTENDFNLLKIKTANNPQIKFMQHNIVYPFIPYGVYTDFISDSKKGDVLGPIETANGFLVINVAGIGFLEQPEFESEKSKIENTLKQYLTEKYIWESQKEIFNYTNPKMYDEAITLMASKFNVSKKECPGIDNNTIIMEYQFQDKVHEYTVTDFLEFINYTPIYYGLLDNPNDIKSMLKSYLIGIYLYDRAQNVNAEEDKEYMWYKNQYHNRLFIDYYKNTISVPPVSELEINKYYNNNLNRFMNFKTAIVDIYKFKDKQIAMQFWAKIGNYYRQKSIRGDISDSVKYKENGIAPVTKNIHISDSTQDVNLINFISKSNENSVLPTINVNGEYWIVYLSEKSGSEILPYKYAKENIRQTLINKRKSEASDDFIEDLKLKYPVKLNYIRNYNMK